MSRKAELVVVRADTEGPGVQAKRLLAAAKAEGARHVADTLGSLRMAATEATAIGDGGDAYPPGVRAEMSKLAAHMELVSDRLQQMMERSR